LRIFDEVASYGYQRWTAVSKVGAVIIGGDFQGLGILRSLASKNVPLYLLDHELCIARFSRYPKRFARCPAAREENRLFNFLIDLAMKENLDGWVIYPNDDETVSFLARYKKQLETHYRVTTPPWDIVKLTYDKKSTYQLAEQHGISIPRTIYPTSLRELEELDFKFPVVIKPSIKEPFFSITKKKAILAETRQQLIEVFKMALSIIDISQIMVQDFIPGGPNQLFSVGSLFKGRKFLGDVVAKRTRQHPMDFGHATTYAETVDIPELEEIARSILGLIGYYGLSEVEFMLDPRDGRYKLLEINARAWGWHTLAIAAGVDLPYMLYQDMIGEITQANGFRKGIKWIRLTTDIPTATKEILKGNLRISDYVSSLRGRKHFAVLCVNDPVPFIAELLMIPYLWKKRGF
jgi:predicted ATP-grasp superfamily ATP-dependent carboligase